MDDKELHAKALEYINRRRAADVPGKITLQKFAVWLGMDRELSAEERAVIISFFDSHLHRRFGVFLNDQLPKWS